MGNRDTFRRTCRWCLALALVGVFSTTVHGEEAAQGDALDRARTLYQLALALEVDSAAMRAARDAYEEAASDPRLATAAQAGIDQTADRLENSDEMFRNVWSGIWQLRGDHGAFELYDSHVELALDRAWSRVVGQITIRGIPRAPVYPRCAGDDESCGILRDMVLLSSHGHNRLREVTDDELRRYLGPDLTMGSVGEVPRAVVRQRLLGAMPESTVLVADIQVHPDVLAPDPVSRVSVSLMKWDLQKDTYAPIAFSEDVGIDVIPRWRHAGFLWLIVLALMAFLGISTQLFRGPSTSALASVVLVGVGVAWAFGAQEVIDGWLPAMDDLAWDPDQNPLFVTWLWPCAQGLVLTAGPLAIGFLAVWTARARAAGYVDLEALKLKLVTPPIMAGALLANAEQLPILFGDDGAIQFAGLFVGMLAPGTVAGWTAGEMFEEGLPDTRQGVAVAISLLSGLACFVLYGLGAPVVMFGAVGATGAVVAWLLQRGASQLSVPAATATIEATDVAAVSGDLSHPEHVDRDGAPVADAMAHHDADEPVTLVVVRGISGSGKTRYAQELLGLMAQRKALQVVRAQAGAGSDVGGAAPYAALSLLLRNVLPVEALHSTHEKREALVAMARDVGGGALEAMPGVGLLMGVLPDEEAQ
ncbi:MAG: hypothetical protein VX938_01820, partial [Myxococcota bacterium]|nr:hypothetical protein [Myxococcota bacterium]